MGLHLDFETYSAQDLKKTNAFRYAEDPSTEALMVGWALGDMTPEVINLRTDDALDRLDPVFSAISRGVMCVAHNAQFERVIWENATRWPVTPKPEQWNCTAARARMLAMPGSLDGAAEALGVPIRKDPRGKALIKFFCSPDPKTGERNLPEDYPEEYAEFMEYCKQDVAVEMAIDKVLPMLSQVEQDAFTLDYKINEAGMPVNMERVNIAKDFVEEHSEKLFKRAVEISGCRPTQIEKTREFFSERGHDLPNLQASTVEALAQEPGLDPDLKELIDLRIELSRAGTKKLTAIQNHVSEDGRLRGGFLFSAASTRRWSSVGVQVHNLQKPEGETNPEVALDLLADDPSDLGLVFERPMTVLAQSIRGFFESEQHLQVADYSSVEPRGLAWCTHEEWLLKAYHNGEDVYKVAAGKVYNKGPEAIGPDERFMGKQIVLGCGYGMGWERFMQTVAKFGRMISEDDAKEAVFGYRNSVPQITRFWLRIEQACILATTEWRPVKVGMFTCRPATLSNGVRLLYIDMPSGSICYPKPFVKDKETPWGQIRPAFHFWTPLGSNWVPTDTFGGSLVENIIQALTRDILRDGLLGADRAGHKIIGHVHDEGIAEGDDNPADLADFEHHLCSSSEWADGFPIATEGYISRRYKK